MGVRVCLEEYPKGFYPGQREDGFPMNQILKQQLDYYLQNITDDWDFTIVITGSGLVRVGKSYLASQIAAYWVSEMKRRHGVDCKFTLKDNFVFDGKELIKKGNHLGQNHQYSPLIFDEAGADLEGSKSMLASTRAVKDYLRECGQYNMLTILVMPEFFDLPKGIAVNRSACLLDVHYTADSMGNFIRGRGKFYGRPAKRQLYIKGKKDMNYFATQPDFDFEFPRFFPLSEEEYRKMKAEALKKRESGNVDKKLMQRNIAWHILNSEVVSKTALKKKIRQLQEESDGSEVFDAKIMLLNELIEEDLGMTQDEIARRTTDYGSYTIQQTIQAALQGLKMIQNSKEDTEEDLD